MSATDYLIGVAWFIAAILAGAGFFMMGPTPEDFMYARYLFIAAGIILGVGGIIWGFASDSKMPIRIAVVFITGGAAIAGINEALRLVSGREAALTALPEINLFAECTFETELRYPPSGHMNVLQLIPLTNPNQPHPGLGQMWGPPGASTGFKERPMRCTITNYAPFPVFSVIAKLRLRYNEALSNPKQPHTLRSGATILDKEINIEISKIDGGKDSPFVFWVMNGTDFFAQVDLPKNVSLTTGPRKPRREVEIVLAQGLIMHFSPEPK